MGLDQYARVRFPAMYNEPIQIAQWRKHNRLHGWMEDLFRSRGGDGEFNTPQEVQLSLEDIDSLEQDIIRGGLPETTGFFFGSDSYEEYTHPEYGDQKNDEEFIRKARICLERGGQVSYTSWW